MDEGPLRIAILNDLHPDESPGAASIALSLATAASRGSSQCEFWCSSQNPSALLAESSGSLALSLYGATSRSGSRVTRRIREYFEIKSLVWVMRNVQRFKPNVVWTHQIGNVYPRFLLVYCWVRRVKVYSTLHDYSLIVPRKLFPSDFRLFDFAEGVLTLGKFDPFEVGYARFYLKIRLSLNRFLYNHFSNAICISPMQASIYQHFGFRVFDVIQNGVIECQLDHSTIKLEGEKVNLLFVGRMMGKGLHHAINLTASNSQLHLLLVGESELENEAAKSLHHSRFTYFGKLDFAKLVDIYHITDYVAVLSECFDVFPGVLMEALSHGCKVLTSDSVGNSHFGIKESLTTIIRSQEDLDAVKFEKNKKTKGLRCGSHSDAVENYLRIFQKEGRK